MPLTSFDGVVTIDTEFITEDGTVTGNQFIDARQKCDIELEAKQQLTDYGIYFKITDLQKTDGYVEFIFYDETGDINKASQLYFPLYDEITFDNEISVNNKCTRIKINIYGSFILHNFYIYGRSTSVKTATSTTTGTVRPLPASGLKIVEIDNTTTGEKAGDLSLNIGDGLHVTQDGKISTTSDLSGSNWQSLDVYNDGFIVNGTLTDGVVSGGYHFKWLSNGDLLYQNANRTIRCSYNNSTKPAYVAVEEDVTT